jgi:hypothetical protein
LIQVNFSSAGCANRVCVDLRQGMGNPHPSRQGNL